ncbi:MAG: pimeloyl-ACP methyl ester carboxylesterase [Saprospiraceae bacterium]|jgi:pimeloyl-ACP methyl ester carboxylesterase
MKKAIYIILGIIGLLAVGLYFFVSSGPYPSEAAEVAISKALTVGVTPIEDGETGFADNNGVKIWYEHIGAKDSSLGTILLVMGLNTTGINFSEYFYQPLVDAGYDVIIYDNRDVGRSDWIEDWNKDNAYSLEDMAGDGFAILDHLNIRQAHIVGVSMGGMIAQSMALNNPDRTLSLGSIMTSGYMMDPDIRPLDTRFEKIMIKVGVRYFVFPSEVNQMRFAMIVADAFKGKGDYKHNYDRIANRTLYELRDRKGFNPNGTKRHTAAIEASGSRYEDLKKLQVPTIAIHGTTDPLVWPDHVKKYAPMIPNAEMLWIEGMGHDIPEKYAPEIVEGLIRNFKRGSERD